MTSTCRNCNNRFHDPTVLRDGRCPSCLWEHNQGLQRECDETRARAEKVAAALHLATEDAALWRKSESEASKAYDDSQAELARVQAQAAGMREALLIAKRRINAAANNLSNHPIKFIDDALSSDSAPRFIPIERVKPLIEAARSGLTHLQLMAYRSPQLDIIKHRWEQALALARELGLEETK